MEQNRPEKVKAEELETQRPQDSQKITNYVLRCSPSVKGNGQEYSYDKAYRATTTRVFDWLALGASCRGEYWDRKRLRYVAWITNNRAKKTLVLHWVSFLWYGRGVLRLRNKFGPFLPKSFWNHGLPEAGEEFELSLLPEELLNMDPGKFFNFVEWHNDPRGRLESDVKLPLEFAPGFRGFGYSWTRAAWESHERGEGRSRNENDAKGKEWHQ